jgi:hypothetical protein
MNKSVTLDLPEAVYNNLYQIAQQKGLSLEKLITEWLSNFNQLIETQPNNPLSQSPAFGILKDRKDLNVESYIDESRQGRFEC